MIQPASLLKLQVISPDWYFQYMRTHAFDSQSSKFKQEVTKMVDISEFTKASGTFLKAEHVTNAKSRELVIVGEPKIVDKEFDGKKSQAVQVEGEMDSIAYKFDLSKTNARTVSEKLGSDTKNWNGSILVLETYKTKATNGPNKGKLIDAINIKEVKKVV